MKLFCRKSQILESKLGKNFGALVDFAAASDVVDAVDVVDVVDVAVAIVVDAVAAVYVDASSDEDRGRHSASFSQKQIQRSSKQQQDFFLGIFQIYQQT